MLPYTDTTDTQNAPAQSTDLSDLPVGVPPLTTMYLYIAGGCNLACRHCWITPTFHPDGKGGQYVQLELIEKAIREGKTLGLRSVKLTGGEPLLHPQFRELVTLLSEEGLDTIIETNGTLIDDSMAEFLKQKDVRFVSVSLDGAKAETHDYLRSVPGSYLRAIAGIEALVRFGFRPQVICTLHQGNKTEMAEVVALARSLGCGSVKFNHVQSTGRGERFAKQAGFNVPEVLDLYHYAMNVLQPQTPIPIFFDVPDAFLPIRRLLDPLRGRCAILRMLGVLAGGELSLCGIAVTIPGLIYGHLQKDSIREIWINGPILKQLREQIPVHLEGICGQCLHRDTCLGHCIANNYHVAGKLNAELEFCSLADRLGYFPASRKIAL